MTLLQTPIRLLLVAIFTIALPLLCCCPAGGVETASEATAVAQEGEHACCDLPEEAPAPEHDAESCACETHLVSGDALPAQVEAPIGFSTPAWIFDLPLVPSILTLGEVPQPLASSQFTSESSDPILAPTLRALSVLLTV